MKFSPLARQSFRPGYSRFVLHDGVCYKNQLIFLDAHNCHHSHWRAVACDRVLQCKLDLTPKPWRAIDLYAILGSLLLAAILSGFGFLRHRSWYQNVAIFSGWCCNIHHIRSHRHAHQKVSCDSVVLVGSHDHRVWLDDDAGQPLFYVSILRSGWRLRS